MELENFKTHMQILNQYQADEYRKRYINKYINTNSKFYIDRIETLTQFSDGLCCTGYLWESLKSPMFIHEEQIETYRSHAHFFPEDVYLTDETLQWTIVFTHEDDINNRRLIMQVGL